MVSRADGRSALKHAQDDDRCTCAQAVDSPLAVGDNRSGPRRSFAATSDLKVVYQVDEDVTATSSSSLRSEVVGTAVSHGLSAVRRMVPHLGALLPMRITASWFGSTAGPPNTSMPAQGLR